MSYFVTEPSSRKQWDLHYFLEWQPRLWCRPFLHAIGGVAGLQDLAGKRVLDFGCRYGKMSCLFGIFGATVVGVDIDKEAIKQATEEVRKHSLQDRVKTLHITGDLRTLNTEPFDIVFTKSVLYFRKNLDETLGQIHGMLRPHGRVIFVENYRGSELEAQLRYQLIRLIKRRNPQRLPGIRKAQFAIFQEWFEDQEFKTYWRLCCTITGLKKNCLAA